MTLRLDTTNAENPERAGDPAGEHLTRPAGLAALAIEGTARRADGSFVSPNLFSERVLGPTIGETDIPGWRVAMISVLRCANWAVRWGLLGFVSGLLSCVMSQSYIVVRNQRTLDHIIWPGMVFAVVVLLPVSRWAGDGWLRTTAAIVASSAIYPITWQIAASGIRRSGPYMIAVFTLAGFLGSFALAGVFLIGRPRWLRSACATVILGTAIGGLMGAQLRAAMSGINLLFLARDGLAVFMVVWQAVVSASLARGVTLRFIQPEEVTGKALNSGGIKP